MISDTAITDMLLKPKRVKHGEIATVLFELCNLSCAFCPQDHGSMEGVDTVPEKTQHIIEAIDVLVSKGKSPIQINLQGGEVFHDDLPDRIFDQYYEMIRTLHDYARDNNIEVTITPGTNLIHQNTKRVIDFLKRVNRDIRPMRIMVSYDPVARFSRKSLSLFEHNLGLYEEFIGSISLTLTRPNILHYLQGKDKVFERLYRSHDCFFDFYLPEKNVKIHAPKDHELQEFFLMLLESYPKAGPIGDLLKSDSGAPVLENPIGVPKPIHPTIDNREDGYSGLCDVTDDNQLIESSTSYLDMEHKFVTDMGCLTCSHFTKCGLANVAQYYFHPEYHELDECWMKRIHEEVELKKGTF